ncbi:MAG: signal peptidase I [Sphingomonadales bacterium]|nr:signal peptidase I [Sphingomonadales bacterium]
MRFLLVFVLLALALRSFVIAPFSIPSRSMTPTLMVGDYLFTAKWSYGYSRYSLPFSPALFDGRIGEDRPARGDIVVFRAPADPAIAYVKRVIGLPGDRVAVEGGRVILNGEPVPRTRIADFLEPLEEAGDCRPGPGRELMPDEDAEGRPVCRTPRYRETLPGGRSYTVLDAGDVPADDFAEVTVPEGGYFLLGDDRDRSADSRFEARRGGGVGIVPEQYLVGKALVVFWSSDGTASWWNPASWFTATRWNRIGESF